jgi:hypothetical protein
MDVAIGKAAGVEQPRHVPALRKRPDLGRGAEVEEEQPHLLASPRGQKRIAEICGKPIEVAAGGKRRQRTLRILLQRVKTM